jgi:hypothetical protein
VKTGGSGGSLGVIDGTGGLVGSNSGNISNSYSAGTVKGTCNTSGACALGGLVGTQTGTGGTITNSYSTSTVEGAGTTSNHTGGLVGAQTGGTITNSYSNGTVKKSGSGNDRNYVGGLVGYQNGGTIEKSYSTSTVTNSSTGAYNVGGLVGNQDAGTIKVSYFIGNVINESENSSIGGTVNNVGGLAGYTNGTIENSYSIGIVWGRSASKVGRLTGGIGSSGTIFYTYSVAELHPTTSCDGLLGTVYSGDKITNSFYNNELSPDCQDNGHAGEGKSTADMKLQSTFTGGWNFATNWSINAQLNDGYPYLKDNPPPAGD